jgi:hypothetical protein
VLKLSVVLAMVLAWAEASACDCPIRSIKEHFCRAHFVVLARIHSTWLEQELPLSESQTGAVDFNDSAMAAFSTGGANVTHYEKIESFKGDSTIRGSVFSPKFQGACGVKLEKNSQALLFIHESGGIFSCGGNVISFDEVSGKNLIVELKKMKRSYVLNPSLTCPGTR